MSDNGLFCRDSFSSSHHHRVSNYCIIYREMTRLFSQTTRHLPETKSCTDSSDILFILGTFSIFPAVMLLFQRLILEETFHYAIDICLCRQLILFLFLFLFSFFFLDVSLQCTLFLIQAGLPLTKDYKNPRVSNTFAQQGKDLKSEANLSRVISLVQNFDEVRFIIAWRRRRRGMCIITGNVSSLYIVS